MRARKQVAPQNQSCAKTHSTCRGRRTRLNQTIMRTFETATKSDWITDRALRGIIAAALALDYTAQLADTVPTGAGLEDLAKAKQDGRPVLFVTGHFGNHDAPRHVLNRLGYTIGGIYKPISNPYFNEHYVKTITEVSGPVFPVDREGMAIGRNCDQNGCFDFTLFWNPQSRWFEL